MCVHVCAWVHVGVYLYICVHVTGGQSTTSGILTQVPLNLSLKKNISPLRIPCDLFDHIHSPLISSQMSPPFPAYPTLFLETIFFPWSHGTHKVGEAGWLVSPRDSPGYTSSVGLKHTLWWLPFKHSFWRSNLCPLVVWKKLLESGVPRLTHKLTWV